MNAWRLPTQTREHEDRGGVPSARLCEASDSSKEGSCTTRRTPVDTPRCTGVVDAYNV